MVGTTAAGNAAPSPATSFTVDAISTSGLVSGSYSCSPAPEGHPGTTYRTGIYLDFGAAGEGTAPDVTCDGVQRSWQGQLDKQPTFKAGDSLTVNALLFRQYRDANPDNNNDTLSEFTGSLRVS